MKNGFTKVFIALVVFLFPCRGIVGQTTIWEIPSVVTDGSLIRNLDDGVDLSLSILTIMQIVNGIWMLVSACR